jgi:hypothetical protein
MGVTPQELETYRPYELEALLTYAEEKVRAMRRR